MLHVWIQLHGWAYLTPCAQCAHYNLWHHHIELVRSMKMWSHRAHHLSTHYHAYLADVPELWIYTFTFWTHSSGPNGVYFRGVPLYYAHILIHYSSILFHWVMQATNTHSHCLLGQTLRTDCFIFRIDRSPSPSHYTEGHNCIVYFTLQSYRPYSILADQWSHAYLLSFFFTRHAPEWSQWWQWSPKFTKHAYVSFHVKSTQKIFTLTDMDETWFLHSVCWDINPCILYCMASELEPDEKHYFQQILA